MAADLTAFEAARQARIADNQARLHALGLPSLVNNLHAEIVRPAKPRKTKADRDVVTRATPLRLRQRKPDVQAVSTSTSSEMPPSSSSSDLTSSSSDPADSSSDNQDSERQSGKRQAGEQPALSSSKRRRVEGVDAAHAPAADSTTDELIKFLQAVSPPINKADIVLLHKYLRDESFTLDYFKHGMSAVIPADHPMLKPSRHGTCRRCPDLQPGLLPAARPGPEDGVHGHAGQRHPPPGHRRIWCRQQGA
jgi:hypothetical protein